ncbi:hypothetical protein HK097_007130 [Rhizophlyctis rosea]|uniref:Gag protein n=1 Tax=Rhizophlyctis rosea TaxID=64517 RepID=A0AAD5X854_9FUNG|nr:hypothetical protein HK097_007130 [Rhizophlyctis rosea]
MELISQEFTQSRDIHKTLTESLDNRFNIVIEAVDRLARHATLLSNAPSIISAETDAPIRPVAKEEPTFENPDIPPCPSLLAPSIASHITANLTGKHNMPFKTDMEILESMLQKLPKLSGAGKPGAFIECINKVDGLLEFSRGKASEKSLVLHIELNSEKSAEKFMENLWATTLRPTTWVNVINDDHQIIQVGLRTHLIKDFMPPDWKETILNCLHGLCSSQYANITNFNHAFNVTYRQLDERLPFWQIHSIYLNAIAKETAKFLEASPDDLSTLEEIMACAVKVASRTELFKQPSQLSSTDKVTANVTVTGSRKSKETWSERRKRQKEEEKAGGSANPGDGKSATPGSSNVGNKGGGGEGKSNSSGGGSGGK